MTFGSSRISAGVAFGDALAVVEDGDAVADPHDDAHVVLDEEDREAELVAELRDQARHLGGLVGVHAGRRLVEEQELRLARERARDLEAPLVAVREVARQLLVAIRQADERHELAARGPGRPPPRGSARRDAKTASTSVARSRVCMPTSTFSMAVMFWKRRMFWNVRPTPARTMSFGRPLLKMPNLVRRCWYQNGRMIASSSIAIRKARAIGIPISKASELPVAREMRKARSATMSARADPQDRFERGAHRRRDQLRRH